MDWLVAIFTIIILCFGFVLLYGAPYVPTLKKQVNTAMDMLDLKPGQTMLELGSGDGRVLRAAAARGIIVVGYELNPIMVFVSRIVTFKYRTSTTIIWGDYMTHDWPLTDGIFAFILQKYTSKLNTKIINYTQKTHKSIKLVSFAFAIPDQKTIIEKDGLFLYHYK